jgi:hypothetical protein
MERPHYCCFDERCLELARYFYPDVADALLRPLAQLLQDAAESFSEELCRCSLSTCGAVFVKDRKQSGPGAPRRQFCCKEHAEDGNREQARWRMARLRARAASERRA